MTTKLVFKDTETEEAFQSTMFNVDEMPIMNNFDEEETRFKVIYNTKTNKYIDVPTVDYSLFKNKDLFKVLKPEILAHNGIISEVHNFGDARFKYKIDFPDHMYNLDGRELNANLTIINSYDRTSRVKLIGGCLVLICTNGMTIGEIAYNESIVHTGDRVEHFDAQKAIRATLKKTDAYVDEKILPLTESRLEETTMVKMLGNYPDSYQKRMVDMIARDRPVTNWDMLNIVTEYFTHEADISTETANTYRDAVVNDFMKIIKE